MGISAALFQNGRRVRPGDVLETAITSAVQTVVKTVDPGDSTQAVSRVSQQYK